jgi:MFS family permease
VVFMVFAVIFGVLSDKGVMDRRQLLCIAVVFWSIATAAAGLATNLTQLIALRSLVGVGEAAYGTKF